MLAWVLISQMLVIECLQHALDKRIIGGDRSSTRWLSTAVLLRGDDPFYPASTFCGATLIDSRWLLTAANCFIGNTSDGGTFNETFLWSAQIGSTKVSLYWQLITGKHGVKNRQISHIFMHPNYTRYGLINDIALVRLSKAVNTEMQRALFPRKVKKSTNWPMPNDICFISGWGCTRHNGPVVSTSKIVRLDVIENKKCKELYNGERALNNGDIFCAGDHNASKGLCSGDNGSGLFCLVNDRLFLQGIAIAAEGDYPGQYPAAFTRIASFRSWINDTINRHLL